MSTRKAKDNSRFHQHRYASSSEYERGLIANLVAKRCSVLASKTERELVWHLQSISHRDGGIPALASDLLNKHPDQFQTVAMSEFGTKPGKIYTAAQVRIIREQMPRSAADEFPLKGETNNNDFGSLLDGSDFQKRYYDGNHAEFPTSYPASKFVECCICAAYSNLEDYLREICLNPAIKLETGPWYFPGLMSWLREFLQQWKLEKSKTVVTTLGEKIYATLDYCAQSPCLTLMEGRARMGKSFAARAWCEQHPGKARFVEVPPGNDDASFFRALARGLGLGNFLSYKVIDIRERVESVLLTGDLQLVLDEAQRLWPQRFRYSFPSRIEWVMTMVNAGVPISCISTPQFVVMQKAIEKNGWNSDQLTGRISHYESLPADLTPNDLMAVAKAVLPEANSQILRALAIYARSSARYLAAIDTIAKRARYIAQMAGRAVATTDDVRRAMQESVIPADTKLHRALEAVMNGKRVKMSPVDVTEPEIQTASRENAPVQIFDIEENIPPRSRPEPIAIGSRNRAGNPASLVEA